MPEHQQIQQSKKPDTIFQKQATPVVQTPISNPYTIIQRARINPKSLTHADIMQLQRTIGNRAVGRLLSGIVNSSAAQQATVQRQEISEEICPSCMQRQEIPEEEEPLQGKMIEIIQRQEIPEEEEPLQGKMIGTVQRQEIPEEEEPLQGKFEDKPEIACPSCFAAPIVQRQEIPEEEEPLQGKIIGTIQRQEIPEEEEPLQTKRENNTGMPDNLKAGVESLSGLDMSDVRVHYNSSKPAEVGALAYTQGTEIHVAPGQEKHLPHEAWHVVQQSQGRVKPTMQLKDGIAVNDDEGLEHEADEMGKRAFASGQDVFFQKGAYESRSRREQELIAHELTHVVQQNRRKMRRLSLPLKNMPQDENTSTYSVKSTYGFTIHQNIPISTRQLVGDQSEIVMRKKLMVTDKDLLYGRKEARNELEETWGEHTDDSVMDLLDSKIDLKNQTIMDHLGLDSKEKMNKCLRDRDFLETKIASKIIKNKQNLEEWSGRLEKVDEEIGKKSKEIINNEEILNKFSNLAAMIIRTLKEDQEILGKLKEEKAALSKNLKFFRAQNRYLVNYTKVYNDIKHYVSQMGSKDITGSNGDGVEKMCKYGITMPASEGKGGKVKFLLGHYSYTQLANVPAKTSDSITDHEMRAAFRYSLINDSYQPEFYIKLSELHDMLKNSSISDDDILTDTSKELKATMEPEISLKTILEVKPPWKWPGTVGDSWAKYNKERRKLDTIAR